MNRNYEFFTVQGFIITLDQADFPENLFFNPKSQVIRR